MKAEAGHSFYSWTVQTSGVGTDAAKLMVTEDTGLESGSDTLNLITGDIHSTGSVFNGPAPTSQDLPAPQGTPVDYRHSAAVSGMASSLRMMVQGGGGNSELHPHPELQVVYNYLTSVTATLLAAH